MQLGLRKHGRHFLRYASATWLLSYAFLSGCGGGGSSDAHQSVVAGENLVPSVSASAQVSTPTSTATPQSVPVTLTYNFATSAAATASPTLLADSTAHRHLEYISSSNTLMTISVKPIGGSATMYGPNACTSGSCTASFTALPGPTLITFTLTDGSSTVLSTFSTTTIIQPSTINTIGFTANPVVSSVAIQLASASVNAGTPANVVLTVNAKDADGNTIVGNSNYVDSTGNPVSFSLDVTNNQSGGRGTVAIQGPSLITAPGQATTYAHYDGNWLSSSTISVKSSSSAVTSLTGTTLSTVPYATIYSSGLSANADILGITNGPDGNLWFVEYGGNRIGRITPSGTITEFSSGITAGAAPNFITTGPDGNLWFTENIGNRIGRITKNGTITEFSGMTGTFPAQIRSGPDGNLWFTESGASNKVGVISTTGNISDFSLNGTTPRGIITGLDNNIWITYQNSSMISRIAPSSHIETDFPYTDSSGGGYPDALANGSDGDLWFIDESGYSIQRYAYNSGTITPFTSGITGAGINCIVAGPDGNLWFTEYNNAYIARITTSGTVTEFGSANGLVSGTGPVGITVGSDGNLWITESAANQIVKFVL